MTIVCATLIIHFYLISSPNVEFLFPSTPYAPPSLYYTSFKIIEPWEQNQILQNTKFSNLPKSLKIAFSMLGNFHYSHKFHIFTTKRFRLKSLLPSQFFKHVKGYYMRTILVRRIHHLIARLFWCVLLRECSLLKP
jgi:hypothetical protein